MTGVEITFYVLAALAIFSAVLVISVRQPVYSALSLVLTLSSLAGIYLLLHAEFLAVVQILTYAGAILVLFIFIIMLLNLKDEELQEKTPSFFSKILTGAAALALFLVMRSAIQDISFPEQKLPADFGTVVSAGKALFTDYVIPFEVVGVLLTIALVGALLLAKRRLGNIVQAEEKERAS